MASEELRGNPPKDRESTGVTLQTVERALRFLEVVATSSEPPSIRDMADRLGINLTTCYHLFNTLLGAGYIERNQDASLRVGYKIAGLYDGYLQGSTSARRMNELVEELAGASQETAWISTLVGDKVVLSAFAEGTQAVRAAGLTIGLSGNEHVRSSGRAVLAFLEEPRRREVLDAALRPVDPEQLPEIERRLAVELELVRDRGWALDDESYQRGIVGVAAPYFDNSQRVLGAVGIWAPAPRGHEHLEVLVVEVLAAAKRATETLGRFGPASHSSDSDSVRS